MTQLTNMTALIFLMIKNINLMTALIVLMIKNINLMTALIVLMTMKMTQQMTFCQKNTLHVLEAHGLGITVFCGPCISAYGRVKVESRSEVRQGVEKFLCAPCNRAFVHMAKSKFLCAPCICIYGEFMLICLILFNFSCAL